MQDESELNYCSSTYSSSTCIANVFPEKISYEKQMQSSYCSFRGKFSDPKYALFKDPEMIPADKTCEKCSSSIEPLCHVKLESIDKLKESTKQLLCLLEEIQTKTHGKNIPDENLKITNYIKSLPQDDDVNSEGFSTIGLKTLEANAKNLDAIYIEDDHDSCSVYNRLIRKCICLNHPDYNDFVIHFNEDSKYTTSNLGEIIKNMRILKKFLYMGGNYTRNALMFLNEGMMESPHSERVEITQACSNADICNLFDDHSIVIVCISWPCINKYYGDYVTQALAAGFLYKLVQLEEGRRYLNYSSKITNDIKKVLRKNSTSIEVDTIESLNTILNLLKPVFVKNLAVTYFSKAMYEGVGKRTICDLAQHRKYMTFEEVLMHLEILDTFSQYDSSQTELTLYLPLLLVLLKHLIMEYDNSEINTIVTSILNSIVSKNVNEKESEISNTAKTVILVETTTQASKKMKSEEIQFPPKKANKQQTPKKLNKSKTGLGVSPNKFSQLSKRKVSEWEPANVRVLNRSKKFNNAT
ncbi:uncharacterized protein LOC123870092 [Maniola jurtina]|uniref:uncharacterized protein LOC123870092 n=1 Tax=Maniola jurtina TaxID=191418 RepID=UPI001E68A54F|nr:uncharacterized protein LOC123870092 [Maniola jurtina]XP_045769218.1 uncharacterized protein LOC123870092 [Maniola jurtina]